MQPSHVSRDEQMLSSLEFDLRHQIEDIILTFLKLYIRIYIIKMAF